MPPNFEIINERERDGRIVVTVDTSKATYQGFPWVALGDFGKRKLENLLVLSRPKELLTIHYA